MPSRNCRPGPAFTVELFPSFSRADEGIELVFDPQDLYCHRVGGHASGRYPSTLDQVTRNVHGIDAAIRGVPGMNDVRQRWGPDASNLSSDYERRRPCSACCRIEKGAIPGG